LTEVLFYSANKEMENMEFLKAMLAEMNTNRIRARRNESQTKGTKGRDESQTGK
jgi:hypothetical protein